MDVAALIVAVLAFVAAGWSAWAVHRQAKAAEAQAQAAAEANRTAVEALELARNADAREQSRLHVEERPTFEVSGKRAKHQPLRIDVTIKNSSPRDYDEISVSPDMDDTETHRLVRDLNSADTLADSAVLGSAQPGETLATALVRTSIEATGKVKLLVTARRAGREWMTVHYVTVARPPRVYSL